VNDERKVNSFRIRQPCVPTSFGARDELEQALSAIAGAAAWVRDERAARSARAAFNARHSASASPSSSSNNPRWGERRVRAAATLATRLGSSSAMLPAGPLPRAGAPRTRAPRCGSGHSVLHRSGGAQHQIAGVRSLGRELEQRRKCAPRAPQRAVPHPLLRSAAARIAEENALVSAPRELGDDVVLRAELQVDAADADAGFRAMSPMVVFSGP